MGLTLRSHPLSFLRSSLQEKRYITCQEANNMRDGGYARTAGMVLVRQMPGTATGVLFMTIEDESGVCNLVVWNSLYQKYRRIILTAGLIGAQVRVQREGEVVHLVVTQLFDLTSELPKVAEQGRETALRVVARDFR